jgi:hypothetical protein
LPLRGSLVPRDPGGIVGRRPHHQGGTRLEHLDRSRSRELHLALVAEQ